MEGVTDIYTLRNYGKPVNCSLTTLYPAQVKILSLGVGLGHEQKRASTERETGTIHKVNSHRRRCRSNGNANVRAPLSYGSAPLP